MIWSYGHTHLLPALDSASVATEFMHKCQQSVHALTDLFVGADPVLVLVRHTLAQRVMKRAPRVRGQGLRRAREDCADETTGSGS